METSLIAEEVMKVVHSEISGRNMFPLQEDSLKWKDILEVEQDCEWGASKHKETFQYTVCLNKHMWIAFVVQDDWGHLVTRYIRPASEELARRLNDFCPGTLQFARIDGKEEDFCEATFGDVCLSVYTEQCEEGTQICIQCLVGSEFTEKDAQEKYRLVG